MMLPKVVILLPYVSIGHVMYEYCDHCDYHYASMIQYVSILRDWLVGINRFRLEPLLGEG